jgi:hypothetical protein
MRETISASSVVGREIHDPASDQDVASVGRDEDTHGVGDRNGP